MQRHRALCIHYSQGRVPSKLCTCSGVDVHVYYVTIATQPVTSYPPRMRFPVDASLPRLRSVFRKRWNGSYALIMDNWQKSSFDSITSAEMQGASTCLNLHYVYMYLILGNNGLTLHPLTCVLDPCRLLRWGTSTVAELAAADAAASPVRLSPLGSPRHSLDTQLPAHSGSPVHPSECQGSPRGSPSRMSPLSSPAKSLETELPLYGVTCHSLDAAAPTGPGDDSPSKRSPNRFAYFMQRHSTTLAVDA